MNKVKRMLALVLAVVMILSMSGCGKKNNISTYRGKLNEMLPALDETSRQMSATIDTLNAQLVTEDKLAYEAALVELQTQSQTLIDAYHALANVVAPDGYTDKQKQLKTYADDVELMLSDCVRMYTILEESITSYLTDDTVNQINRLQTEMAALTASSTAFDDLLNEILGVEKVDTSEEESSEASSETSK